MSAPLITATDLVKVYRDFWRRPIVRAVDGLGFELHKGALMAIIGPNGSGKSTTLKMLLGLLRPDEGSLSILGHPAGSIEVKRAIGFLPELSALHSFLTPRQTLDFYGSLFGLKRAERTLRTEQLLEMVRLKAVADRPISGFSKGMVRRVGLAQALVNAPSLLLLDEPTSGLDPEACREMKDLLLALKGAGVTVLMTSHMLGDVEEVCDEVMVMSRGRAVARGPVGDLLRCDDAVRFIVDGVSPSEADRACQTLSEALGRPVRTDSPTLSLEAFFLKTIRSDEVPFKPAPFLLEPRR